MNKVVLLLGIIVLFTLAMIFFSIGFFTGSRTSPGDIGSAIRGVVSPLEEDSALDKAAKIALDYLPNAEDIRSLAISNKVSKILGAAGSARDTFMSIINRDNDADADAPRNRTMKKSGALGITIDSLLKKIAATHSLEDECSHDRTLAVHEKSRTMENNLAGKKVVFLGYFQNETAAQIQKLLATKGYKVHAEHSLTKPDESLVFCGPFAETESANKLADWLREHDFAEVKIVTIAKESEHEQSVRAITDEAGSLPENSERSNDVFGQLAPVTHQLAPTFVAPPVMMMQPQPMMPQKVMTPQGPVMMMPQKMMIPQTPVMMMPPALPPQQQALSMP